MDLHRYYHRQRRARECDHGTCRTIRLTRRKYYHIIKQYYASILTRLLKLAKQCESFTGEVLLTNENVLEYLGNSFSSNPRLKEKCLQFIDAHIHELAEFPEFLDLPCEVMAEIVKRSTMAAKNEIDVFHLIMAWRKHHKEQVNILINTTKPITNYFEKTTGCTSDDF